MCSKVVVVVLNQNLNDRRSFEIKSIKEYINCKSNWLISVFKSQSAQSISVTPYDGRGASSVADPTRLPKIYIERVILRMMCANACWHWTVVITTNATQDFQGNGRNKVVSDFRAAFEIPRYLSKHMETESSPWAVLSSIDSFWQWTMITVTTAAIAQIKSYSSWAGRSPMETYILGTSSAHWRRGSAPIVRRREASCLVIVNTSPFFLKEVSLFFSSQIRLN